MGRIGGGAKVGRRWGVALILLHGPSRMTVDPRMPTVLAWTTPGFHRLGTLGLHESGSTVRCSRVG